MANSIISVKDTSLVQIKLLDVGGAAHIAVNERHFDLKAGETINISASLIEGANVVKLAVTTEPSSVNPANIVSGIGAIIDSSLDGLSKKREWMGRFEIYIDGNLAGSYIKQGSATGGTKEQAVATIGLNVVKDISTPTVMQLVARLRKVEGITGADKKDTTQSNPHLLFKNGVEIRTWKNLIGIDYVFVTNRAGDCLYGGYVGWLHTKHLQVALDEIYDDFQDHTV